MKYRLVAIIASTHSLDGGGKALFGYKDAKGNSKFQTRYFRRRPTKRAADGFWACAKCGYQNVNALDICTHCFNRRR